MFRIAVTLFFLLVSGLLVYRTWNCLPRVWRDRGFQWEPRGKPVRRITAAGNPVEYWFTLVFLVLMLGVFVTLAALLVYALKRQIMN